MTPVLNTLVLWIHALATVVFVGHYLLLTVIYLPVLGKSGNAAALGDISKRSRPWLYASLLVFVVTGIYLMVVDPGYLGFMNLGNLWGVVMLVKHVLIVILIGLGFWFNAIVKVGPQMRSNSGAQQGIARFTWYSKAMAITGIAVMLLTALAQAQ